MAYRYRYIRFFNEVGIGDVSLAGGKNAALGEPQRGRLWLKVASAITSIRTFAVRRRRIALKIPNIWFGWVSIPSA